ncbi:MAG: hypothetical protein L0215_04770 [Gemmataceae bacterium]|nr:hypothetical protein [Gemmataceae bacterium]
MSTRLLAGAACAFLILTSATDANGHFRSGPPVGSPNNRDGFFPNWVTGPCAGKRLCPV